MHDDWDYYWSIQGRLKGSFAETEFSNCKIEQNLDYSDICELANDFCLTFPFLSNLLKQARVTKILTKQLKVYYLLGWSFEYGDFGSITPEPLKDILDSNISINHQLLLRNFGGFIDWFGDVPDSYYFNDAQNWIFSYDDIKKNLNSDDYLHTDIYQVFYLNNSIKPILNLKKDFIIFTEECNSDCFCYNIKTSEVWKFHHERVLGSSIVIQEEYGEDMHLISIEGASEGCFYKVDNCSFKDWVERGAQAWLNCFQELPFIEE